MRNVGLWPIVWLHAEDWEQIFFLKTLRIYAKKVLAKITCHKSASRLRILNERFPQGNFSRKAGKSHRMIWGVQNVMQWVCAQSEHCEWRQKRKRWIVQIGRKATTSYLNLDLDSIPDTMAVAEPKPAQKGRYSDELSGLVADYIASRDREVDDPAERKKIVKDVKQRSAVLGQFVEATGVKPLSDLRQEDMFYYVSVLERLPKIYRKTPEDQARTLEEILERAEELSWAENWPVSGHDQP